MKVWFPTIQTNSGSDVYVGRITKSLQAHGVDAVVTWFPPSYEFFPELMKLADVPNGTDLIHANSWNASVFLSKKIPVVATVHHLVHDPEFRPYRSIMQSMYHKANIFWRERKSILHCSSVVAVSESTAKAVEMVFGRKSHVIHNWVESDFDAGHRQKKESGKFVTLIAGNSGKRKGSDLLPALSSMLGDDFEIRVTGGLRSKRKGVSAAGNIVYLGFLSGSDLLKEYASCDIVASLSRYEGFGYSALEAMSFAKPFVGFMTNGFADVVENGKTGFLVELNDIGNLVEKIKFLRNRPDFCDEMGSLGKLKAKEFFSESVAIEKYINLYQSLLNQ